MSSEEPSCGTKKRKAEDKTELLSELSANFRNVSTYVFDIMSYVVILQIKVDRFVGIGKPGIQSHIVIRLLYFTVLIYFLN